MRRTLELRDRAGLDSSSLRVEEAARTCARMVGVKNKIEGFGMVMAA